MRGHSFTSATTLQRELLQSLKQQGVATPIQLVWQTMPLGLLPSHLAMDKKEQGAATAIAYLRQLHALMNQGRVELDAWGRCRLPGSISQKRSGAAWATSVCLGASGLLAACTTTTVGDRGERHDEAIQRAFVQLQQVRASDGSLMFQKCLYGDSCEPITLKVMDRSIEPVAIKTTTPSASVMLEKPAQHKQPQSQGRAIRYTIYFGFNRFQLGPQGLQAIEGLIKDIRSESVERIAVAASSDPVGSAEVNARFAELRAQQVKAALIRGGVQAGLVEFGEVNDRSMERRGMPQRQTAHAEMRRADVVVYLK